MDNNASLHKLIDPSCLPSDYEGHLGPIIEMDTVEGFLKPTTNMFDCLVNCWMYHRALFYCYAGSWDILHNSYRSEKVWVDYFTFKDFANKRKLNTSLSRILQIRGNWTLHFYFSLILEPEFNDRGWFCMVVSQPKTPGWNYKNQKVAPPAISYTGFF